MRLDGILYFVWCWRKCHALNPKRRTLAKVWRFDPHFMHLRGRPCVLSPFFSVITMSMSWFSNYLFGEYSEESVVPDSYEGAAISASYDIPIPSNTREGEVVSGIRYRDNIVELDLNVPVEDFDAQYGYSDYGYGDEPYPQAEYPYGQPNYPDHGYGGEQSYVQQDYPDPGYGG
ncbi:hypothetical protein HanRHA438_Chr03g0116941 [Helianthus annuus]|nr:hypothetical protein HanRHA438_Chr03g0116941 [Helianthus annuus]